MNYDQPERQYNIAQAGATSYAGVGLAKLGQDVPRVSRLDAPANHLEEMTKGLHEYSLRLNRVVDRLCGSVPEPVEKEAGRSGNSGVVSRYEAIADNYASLLRRLGATVERLESL